MSPSWVDLSLLHHKCDLRDHLGTVVDPQTSWALNLALITHHRLPHREIYMCILLRIG